MPVFTPEALYNVTHLISTRMGSAEAEATEVADHLVRANLAGHDSHGVGMLPTYVRIFHEKLLIPNQTPDIVIDTGALLVIDARRGYGQRMTANAVRAAIGRAKQIGACVLGLRNAAHIGRIGTYGELAAREGCVFTAFVNVADTRDIQATYGAAEARLGTNPFCVAVPGDDGPEVMLDMATTTIAAGKARVAFNKGVPVPDNCLIDEAGNPTNDPAALIRDRAGALLAFGGHKGSGLAIMCEIMAAAIAGGQGAADHALAKFGVMNSMLATIVDISKLGDATKIRADIKAAKAHVKSARPAPGVADVLVPGEPERRYAEQRRANGIEVDPQTWSDIGAAALSLGITEDELARAAGVNVG
jgi:uncharacterized oxidoreductase